ncbi:branched-chain amino acid ABC transporter permease [Bosea sp. 117]|uniref:branched-chain amino acid ABC transporter permease n=1 Tax=Bosea sp. 117 TaxID=1125973 RepID=UPI0004949F3F|nr:branched-chain amino acid ABC transporter permease [Bosea sp. 117]
MRPLLLLVSMLLLAGCARVMDADQARLCRAVAPALHEDDTVIKESALAPLPGSQTSLRLAYTARRYGVTRPHWIICTFGGTSGVDRFDLVAVETDRGTLSDIKLAIMKRWWLPDAVAMQAEAPFRLDGRSAYWLQQAMNGLSLAGIYGLVAVSFALVYGLVGRINLAFGEIAVAGGVNMLIVTGIASGSGRLGGPALILALAAGVAAAALWSWAIGRWVVLPLTARSRSPQPVLIGTIALAIVLGELIRITARQRENWLPPLMNLPVPIAGGAEFTATVTPAQMLTAGLGFSAASFVLGLLAFTSFGRGWRAYADDPLMAALIGVPIPRLLAGTFLLSGATAGLAGTMVVLSYGTIEAGAGIGIALKALICCLIGGIGSIPGAFLGAILLAGIETLWSATFNIVYRDVVIYSLLVAVLVLRPARSSLPPREI